MANKSVTTGSRKKARIRLSVLGAVLCILIIAIFVLMPREYIAVGDQMSPTISEGDSLRVTALNKDYQRGDVVVMQSGDSTTGLLIKRVLALPGDTVTVYTNGSTEINGAAVPEDYAALVDGDPGDAVTFTVQQGSYYLLEDNRAVADNLLDTTNRMVTADTITGKVIL